MTNRDQHDRDERGMSRWREDFSEGYGGSTIGGGYATGGYAGAGYARPEDVTMRRVGRAQGEPPRPFVGRRPKGLRRSPERIREDVCELLTRDPLLDASGLEVRVDGSEVVLEGRVHTRDAKRRAEDLAWSVVGVEDVLTRIRVTRGAAGSPSAEPVEAGTTDVGTAGDFYGNYGYRRSPS